MPPIWSPLLAASIGICSPFIEVCGDDLINHPVSLAFVSKLNSLCRLTLDREMAALSAVDRLARGEAVEYEVIPI
jgi:hypothetical protein